VGLVKEGIYPMCNTERISSRDVAQMLNMSHEDIVLVIERDCMGFDLSQVGQLHRKSWMAWGMVVRFGLELGFYAGNEGDCDEYFMIPKGFALLMMNLPGPSTIEFKLKYIKAFEDMKKHLEGDTGRQEETRERIQSWKQRAHMGGDGRTTCRDL